MSSSDSDEPQECELCCEDAPIDLPAYETWVMCDICSEWYHGVCVGISASECERIDKYHCQKCVEQHGPSSYNGPALRRSSRSHTSVDYTKLNDGQPATFNQYLLRIDAHEFAEDEFEHLETGHTVTVDWIRHRDTNDPFVVDSPEGLGMQMPGQDTTVRDIAKIIGEETSVSVMDVLTQEELGGWTLGQWAQYFHSTDRRRVLNVISLEVSGTPLGDMVQRPTVVDKLDLVDNYWPETKRKPSKFPKVKAYCLMGVADAYTDFHVDFSATWVYYHVLSGEKVFYLVPPTPSNMRKFESWSKSPDQAVSFFAEHVKQCFEVRLKPGNTLFIPAGWIHAVFTPADTVVIGGNFLVMQSLNTHIGLYKLEARTKVPSRYRFPFFLKLCRYLIESLTKIWTKLDSPAKAKWTTEELEGVFVLASFLSDKLVDESCDAEVAKIVADKMGLRKYLTRLIEVVEPELSSRMLPEEWMNREPQLREGSHFRWIRPGMPRGSLLLATRPKRSRNPSTSDGTDRTIAKIRLKNKDGGSRSGTSRHRLVRRVTSSGTTSDASNGDEMMAALGTGQGKDSESSNQGDSGTEVSDEEDYSSSASSDVGSFVVSSDDDSRKPRKRKSHTHSRQRTKSARSNFGSFSRVKSTRQRIAERLKMKF